MRCPLIKIVEQVASATLEVAPANCLKGECAWWDDGDECCMVFEIGAKLCGIAKGLALILEKLPYKREI